MTFISVNKFFIQVNMNHIHLNKFFILGIIFSIMWIIFLAIVIICLIVGIIFNASRSKNIPKEIINRRARNTRFPPGSRVLTYLDAAFPWGWEGKALLSRLW